MAGTSEDWRLFSFLDLPCFDLPFFDALEFQPSAATNEVNDESTSTPSGMDDTLRNSFDSSDLRYFDALEIQTSGVTNGGEHQASDKPFRFLDLPGEIRNRVYDFVRPWQCEGRKSVLFTPQVFIDDFPQSVILDNQIWSCGRLDDYCLPCEKRDCGEYVRHFLELTRVNRQVRNEVRRILYGRRGFSSLYRFHSVQHGSILRGDGPKAVRKLSRVDRHVAWEFGISGIPFAIQRTTTGLGGTGCLSDDLLVPCLEHGDVSWRKFSGFVRDENTKEADYMFVLARELAERVVNKVYGLEASD